MSFLLALDVAAHTGVAFFRDGKLVAAHRLVSTAAAQEARGEDLASNLENFLLTIPDVLHQVELRGLFDSAVVYEFPQVYRREISKADPNDLLVLAALAACIASRLQNWSQLHVTEIRAYRPQEWIGQLPKTVLRRKTQRRGEEPNPLKRAPSKTVLVPPLESPRGKLIRRHLDEAEAEVALAKGNYNHDTWDAIGIGLKHLKRLQPHVNHFE